MSKSNALKFPMDIKQFNYLVKSHSLKETPVFKHGTKGYDPLVIADYVEMNSNSINLLLEKNLITGFVNSEMAFTPSGREELYLLGAEFSTFYGDQGGTVFTINKSDYDEFKISQNKISLQLGIDTNSTKIGEEDKLSNNIDGTDNQLNEPQMMGDITESLCMIS
jgi:hypothetical protein